MRKEYAAEVICLFGKNGKIRPLKFRIIGQRQVYRILSYTEKYRHLEYRQAFMTEFQMSSEIAYDCRIDDEGWDRVVQLRYDIGEMRWTVKLNS